MTYTFELTLGAVGAVIAAVTHLASNTGLPTKLCPWLSLILGVMATVSLSGFLLSPETVISGLILGLASYGLWNGTLDISGKQL